MKKEARLIKAFGTNELGIADLPKKVSGTTIPLLKPALLMLV